MGGGGPEPGVNILQKIANSSGAIFQILETLPNQNFAILSSLNTQDTLQPPFIGHLWNVNKLLLNYMLFLSKFGSKSNFFQKLYRNPDISRNSSGAKAPAICKIFTPALYSTTP